MEPDTQTPPLRPVELGDIFGVALRLYRQHWVVFVAVTATVVVPWEILYVSVTSESDPYAGLPLALQLLESFAVIPLIAGALAKAIADAYVGREPTLGATFGHVAPQLGTLIGIGLLTTVAVFGGFLLLVIPGIIVAARLFAGMIVTTIEGGSVTASMRRSWDLVLGRTGQVLLALISAGLLAVVIAVVIVTPFATSESTATVVTAQVVASLVTTPFTAAVSVLVYLDLRVRKEGLDLDGLARQLGGT